MFCLPEKQLLLAVTAMSEHKLIGHTPASPVTVLQPLLWTRITIIHLTGLFMFLLTSNAGITNWLGLLRTNFFHEGVTTEFTVIYGPHYYVTESNLWQDI